MFSSHENREKREKKVNRISDKRRGKEHEERKEIEVSRTQKENVVFNQLLLNSITMDYHYLSAGILTILLTKNDINNQPATDFDPNRLLCCKILWGIIDKASFLPMHIPTF